MKGAARVLTHRVLVTNLGLTIMAVSCNPVNQPTVAPSPTEAPDASGFVAGALPVAYTLVCPAIPSTDIVLPPAPYDEALGDCALIGRSAEIEAWLTELEQIAEGCLANREENWAATNAVRDDLEAQIDGLALGPDKFALCGKYGSLGGLESGDESAPFSHYYTSWLSTIGKNVGRYCTMVDELVQPLWEACDEINFYQDCQAPDPEQYRATVDGKMNAAQVNYDFTDFFYTNTLQVSGWGNFRLNFDEAAIECPVVEPVTSAPTFTFLKNSFCRKGPSLAYEDVTAFLKDQSVRIDGRNQDEPRWWWVPIPGTSAHCWISDSTGLAAGPIEGASIVAPPPPPTATPAPTAPPRR
jgi:hypothetical protein